MLSRGYCRRKFQNSCTRTRKFALESAFSCGTHTHAHIHTDLRRHDFESACAPLLERYKTAPLPPPAGLSRATPRPTCSSCCAAYYCPCFRRQLSQLGDEPAIAWSPTDISLPHTPPPRNYAGQGHSKCTRTCFCLGLIFSVPAAPTALQVVI